MLTMLLRVCRPQRKPSWRPAPLQQEIGAIAECSHRDDLWDRAIDHSSDRSAGE